MADNKIVRRASGKKKKRPKIRFNIWLMIVMFAITFAGCFVLYMIAANIDDDFFREDFKTVVHESTPDDSIEAATDSEEATEPPVQEIIQNPVPVSAAIDISYLENCCLVTDSILLGMDDTGFSDILGNSELGAATVGKKKVDSNYGNVTVGEALKLKKPMNTYIMLGSDIGVSTTEEMLSAYLNLVSGLKASVPEMKIYIMQLPPAYADAERNALINDFNTRLLTLANSVGVYCIDTNTEFKDNEGNLRAEYINADTGEYTDKFYDDITGYILTHTA
ncbi:MAG: hypothetical protein IJX77_09825 [Ruminococcus sp.]|nr:hypothetical protein [Ruminococcus sp.]